SLLWRRRSFNVNFRDSLCGPVLLALGWDPPGRPRMPPAGAAALAAAERMIDRVHRHAAIVRHAPKPALAAGLADRDVHVVRIRYRADRSLAAPVNEPLLT